VDQDRRVERADRSVYGTLETPAHSGITVEGPQTVPKQPAAKFTAACEYWR